MQFPRFTGSASISKNLALLVMLAVLPALVILLYSGLEQRRQTLEAAKSDVQLLAHAMAEVQKGITSSTRQTLSTLALMPQIQGMNARASSNLFQALIAQNPEYTGIALTDLNGDVIASNRPFAGVNLADRKHVREALAKKDFAVGEYIVTKMGTRARSFAFAYPVLNKEGAPKAVLTLALRLDRFAGFFDVSNLPPDSFVAVTDHQGVRLFYYPPKETNPVGKPIRARNWDVARQAEGSNIFIQQGSDGVRRIFAFEQVRLGSEDAPYIYVWAGIPEARILKPANAVLIRNLLLMLLVTGIALAAAWVVGRKTVISPIKSLVATTLNFAGGSLGARNELAGKPNEFGTLATAFNDMADALARSQEILRKREAHLEEAQRIAHIGSWEWEAATDAPVWSKELCKILGLDPAKPAPPLAEQDSIYTPESMKKMRAAVDVAMQTGDPYEIELEGKRADGSPIWLLARGEVMRDEKGAFTGLRGTALDITDRKLAEQEREKLQAQLLQAQKVESVGRLAGGVAHDFNNMLSVILGYTELALATASPAEQLHAYLKEVEKAARRSADLTRQLLAFARKQTVAPEVLNLNDTLEAMLTMLRRLIGENIDLAWLPASRLWRVKMDPSQIDQVMINLCVNARDAITGVGRITIETKNVTVDKPDRESFHDCVPGKYVMLTVTDTGYGMDQETLANIFEPFFTTKGLGKGTGLGLATVFGIIKQNHGFINVASEPGRETTFTIYLPALPEAAAGKTDDQRPDEALHSHGETVLLVEDDPAVMDLGRCMLERLGYNVLSANTPKEAIRLTREHPGEIHLLITDVIMPEMNGRDLAEQLLANCPNLKCLFMSGYTANVIAHHGVLDEDILFLPKPFTARELALQVRKALDFE